MNDLLIDLLTARRMLRVGASLNEAAAGAGFEPGALDRLLWRYAGRLQSFPTKPRTVEHVARPLTGAA